MSINDALSSARETAKAQSQEDFYFFANHVCGLHIPIESARVIQEEILAGRGVNALLFVYSQHEKAARAWMGIVGKGPMLNFPSETFAWIFGELEIAA